MSEYKNALQIMLFTLALATTACVTTIPTQDTASAPKTEYKLGTGDHIRLIVFGHENLSGEFTVGTAGTISFPLILETQVSGLSIEELEQTITDKLSPDYLIEPRVSVEVLEYRDIYILGEVRTPGKYAYIPDLTVQKAAAIAGGYTYRAKENSAELTRQNDGNIQTQTVSHKTIVLPGDTVVIKRKWF